MSSTTIASPVNDQATEYSSAQPAVCNENSKPASSKLERRPDHLVSTLCRFVEAMGGELELRAHFPCCLENCGIVLAARSQYCAGKQRRCRHYDYH